MWHLLRVFLTTAMTAPLLFPLAAFGRQAERTVIDLRSRPVDVADMQQKLLREHKDSLKLTPPEPDLIEALRWSLPSSSRGVCEERKPALSRYLRGRPASPAGAAVSGGSATDPMTPALLAVTEKHVADAEAKKALEALALLRQWLPCLEGVMSREQLIQLYQNEAIAHVYEGDGKEGEAFANLLAIDPEYTLPKIYGPKVKAPLERARQSGAPNVVGHLILKGVGSTVYVDGHVAADGQPVRRGEHLIQLQSGWGEIRSALVTVKAVEGRAPDAPVALLDLNDFGLLAEPRALEMLTSSLKKRALDNIQRRALEQHLQRKQARSILFGIEGAQPSDISVMECSTQGGLVCSAKGDASVATNKVLPPVDSGSPRITPPNRSGTLKPRVTVGMATQRTFFSEEIAVLDEMATGLAVAAELTVGPVRVGLHGQYLPWSSRKVIDDEGVCGAASTSDEVIGCLSPEAVMGLGVAAWYPVSLPGGLELSPGLSMAAARFGHVVVYHPNGIDVYDLDLVLINPSARAKLSFTRKVGTMQAGGGLELFGGTAWLPASSHDVRIMAFPVGATLSAVLAF